MCDALVARGVPESEIGVISLYRQQLKALQHALAPRYPGIEILTADRSQGRDKDCIIVSMVRSNDEGQARSYTISLRERGTELVLDRRPP